MMEQQPRENTPVENTQAATSKRRPFLKGMLAGGLISALLAGGASVFANAEHHGHFWKAGACKSRHAMRDPVFIHERADFMADWVLDRVDASDEQRAKVKTTLKASLSELLALRTQHHANRDAMRAALTQPAIDRDELERIRSAEMQLAHSASTTFVAAMADIAEVLNPEQRKTIAEMAQRWSGRRHSL